MIQKELGPPAAPLPLTLPQNGTPEASSTNIQLETIQENVSKTHSCELPLLSYSRNFKKHSVFKGRFFYQIASQERGQLGSLASPDFQFLTQPWGDSSLITLNQVGNNSRHLLSTF